MKKVGSFNSPDGRYTIRDDSLPHQIRLSRTENVRTAGNVMTVTCTCGKKITTLDSADSAWLSAAWDAYDEHTMEEA